ncbi:MAG: acylphosphatase [Candidatus Eisenbacteria bacterium]
MLTLTVIVRGRVQGVGFRWFACREARAHALSGRVANRPDGSVELVAAGARADLEALLAALREGPPGSRVTGVEPLWSETPPGRPGFVIE